MKKQKPLVSPRSVSRVLESAAQCWQRRQFEKYFDLMATAGRLDPANHRIFLDLGLAHGIRHDYSDATACFEQAIALAPHKAEALVMAATHCRNFNRYDLARDYLERAVARADAQPDTLVKLAEIYERFRRLDEAGELVDRALKLEPHSAMAKLVRARLDRLSGRLDQAEQILRPLLSDNDPRTWSTRIRGWYELGAILDRRELFDEAMAAFVEAKELIRPGAARYIGSQQSVRTQIEHATANVSRELLERWLEAGKDFQPPRRIALLCGHPRSGTTLLEQVLDAHAQVVSSEETPIFFENYLTLKEHAPPDAPMLSALDTAASTAVRRAREEYFRCTEALLGTPVADRLLIDKNPSLTPLVPAFVRIFPESRFLVALRDPRDVCISFFMQPVPLNLTSASYLTLEGTVQEYATMMGLWTALAPLLPGRFIEVRYEEVVQDLEPLARRVLAFLDVPWDHRVLQFDKHAREKLVRSPTYVDVTKPVHKGAIGRWRNYEKFLAPHLEKLAPFLRAFEYE
jgi:tetratricopeptide (TPR) repeat protein